MMRTVRGLTIDNGGSEIRTLPIGCAVDNGMLRMDTNFVTIREEAFRLKETANALELCRIVKAPCEEYKGIVANGMTSKLYDAVPMQLSPQARKTDSINYYRQIIFAIAQDAMKETLWRREVTSGYLSDPEDMFAYVVTVLIPVREHSGRVDGAAKLKKALAGYYEVEFPLLESGSVVNFLLEEQSIGVLPEGGVAITGLSKDDIAVDDFTLMLDIGHVTTDGALFKGRQMYGSNVMSKQVAGSTLLADIKSVLQEEGFTLTDEMVQKTMQEEQVRIGMQAFSVQALLAERRSLFIKNYIVPEVIQLCTMNGVNTKQIQHFIPVGAMMSQPLIKELIEAMDMQNVKVHLLAKDLRYVNIEQAEKFTRMLYNRLRS